MSRDPTGKAEQGGTAPEREGVRAGALSALIAELVRSPDGERGEGWRNALKPGAVIGRFELVREVGRGGFGVVYEARDRELGRLVAFKAIWTGESPEVREERLLREAEVAARLSHPNIVTLFDVGRSEHGPYLVMELLRGWTLAHRLSQGRLPLRETLRIALELAKGLAHAHGQGVIHRDLTPGNVFLCEDGQVKVLDLGLAHAFGRRKLDGGTPSYMAPEQRSGAPEDERTDVFAMGVMLFEMLAGERPFPEEGERPGRGARGAPELETPEEPALGQLIGRMLSRDPVKRPRDAGEVLATLALLSKELERTPPAGEAGGARPHPVLHGPPPRRPDEHPRPDRTWLCSVLFAGIAVYSEQSVELQAEWKARFNRYLADSIDAVPEADRVILDTGDGAGICFLGDPEAAMSCALSLLGTLGHEEAQHGGGMRARIGIHLGPVRLVRDINGNLNALGDGVNVAQRVMGFADEDQVLVSRSFFEVAKCLSESYRLLFTFGGVRRDEHVHEHAVYELHPPDPTDLGPSVSSAGGAGAQAGNAPAPGLDPAVVERIEARAAAILGPIARHLTRTAAPRASTPLQLIEALAAFITRSEEREAFVRSCGGGSTSSPPRPPKASGSGGRSGSTPAWEPALLERAARDLATFIGPLARILVARASSRARSEEELYDLLAAEIASPPDREAFRRTIHRRVPLPSSLPPEGGG